MIRAGDVSFIFHMCVRLTAQTLETLVKILDHTRVNVAYVSH